MIDKLVKGKESESSAPRLSVRNFGPIVEGEVELRPFTVFVGPSNTGKSYFAMLIYALHQFYSGTIVAPDVGTPLRRVRSSGSSRTDILDIPYSQIIEMADLIESASMDPTLSELGDILIPQEVATAIWTQVENFLSTAGRFSASLERALGVAESSDIIRIGGSKTLELAVELKGTDGESTVNRFQAMSHNSSWKSSISGIPEALTGSHFNISRTAISVFGERIDRLRLSTRSRGLYEWSLLREIIELLANRLTGDFSEPAYYLPSGRTGMLQAQHLAVTSAIRSVTSTGLRQEEAMPQLSGVIGDFLAQLTAMPVVNGQVYGLPNNLADAMEDDMLGGSIELDETVTGYPIFQYQPRGWKKPMPLMRASAMVSELAPVVLYLRHVLHPGDLLIVEEPESHLHPAMQVEFVRQLAKVVKAGIRVLVTTHSEWVLEELANLVRMSDLPEGKRDGLAGADSSLTTDDLGVWLFEPKRRPKGSLVREIVFSADDGGYISDYEDVAIGTHNSWAGIGNRLEELKQE